MLIKSMVQGARAELEYCKNTTGYTRKNGRRPCKYVLIPHNAVPANMSLEFPVKEYDRKA